MLSRPRVLDARYQGEHPQAPEAVVLGNIGAGEEWLLVGRHDDGERPPPATGQHLANVHVNAVNVRPLLAVHLNGDECLIHEPRDFEVLEGFALHNVAPVARGVANRKENRFVLAPRLLESLGSPGIPIHRVVGMLEKIRTLLVKEAIRMFFSRRADVSCHDVLVSQGVDQTSGRHSDHHEQSGPKRRGAFEFPHHLSGHEKTTARGSETNWALVASLALSRALEFVHFGLTAKYQLPTALAHYCGRGGTAKRWVRDSLILCEENNPSPR